MLGFASKATAATTPLVAVPQATFSKWKGRQPKSVQQWLDASGFKPEVGKFSLVPAKDGAIASVVLVVQPKGDIWSFASLPRALPPGRYRLDPEPTRPAEADFAALGWALGTYVFARYRSAPPDPATLVWPSQCDRHEVTRLAQGIMLGRDLINTPANDMGPEQLAAAAAELAGRHGARCKTIAGDALLKQGFPAVHAVGRASDRSPRLVDITWGNAKAPKLTLVGKGVCFDTGGLDLKTSGGMKLMKKDMGGAASVLALAHMVMDAKLDVRLRVLIPAVENSVAGNAFRPLDVLTTRKGITVEVGNTDAEGRLILCDALAAAAEDEPDVLLDFATLTGAARVALGTELPALFCNHDALAKQMLEAGDSVRDPLWRLPLHRPYRRQLDSDVADINNIGNQPYGGAITAALFLQEFVPQELAWAHIDTMAWNLATTPGRPAGGEIFGARAVYAAVRDRFGG